MSIGAMNASASWFTILWPFILTCGIIFSIATVAIIFTLPSSYSHFHPRYLSQDVFSEDSKRHPEKSGYAYYNRYKDSKGTLMFDTSVQIVVLGDIGRSPRMQYHALSIASHGGIVDIIGYNTDSEVHPDISSNAFINIIPIPPWPATLQTNSRILFLLLAPLKVLWQTWSLYHALGYRTEAPSKFMLIQNPPSIPTLLIAQLICFLRNTRLIIDWHNFGYTILALRLGPSHPLVRISAWYEGIFSQGASAHLCVTNAMARVLLKRWNVKALSLHDRPPGIFQPLSSSQRADFLRKNPVTSPFAQALLSGERRLLVSSTSWTADEDFSILLDALVRYSSAVAKSQGKLPDVLAIITGRGPQREYYLRRIEALKAEKKLERVEVTTAWLSAEDYASLLGAADLGVSLHTSSSGVDLPMKVVDMFGTGLPVVGWDAFEAWPELVKEGVNGRGFESVDKLVEILEQLFGGDAVELKVLREGAMKECERRWEDEWMPVAGKLFGLSR